MHKQVTYRKLLEIFIAAKGIDLNEFSHKTQVSRSYLEQVIDNQEKRPSLEVHSRIKEGLDLNEGELLLLEKAWNGNFVLIKSNILEEKPIGGKFTMKEDAIQSIESSIESLEKEAKNETTAVTPFNELLRFYRKRSGMTQKELAEKIETHSSLISQLERNNDVLLTVRKRYVENLADIFELNAEEKELFINAASASESTNKERSKKKSEEETKESDISKKKTLSSIKSKSNQNEEDTAKETSYDFLESSISKQISRVIEMLIEICLEKFIARTDSLDQTAKIASLSDDDIIAVSKKMGFSMTESSIMAFLLLLREEHQKENLKLAAARTLASKFFLFF